jgi:hypothetical protein
MGNLAAPFCTLRAAYSDLRTHSSRSCLERSRPFAQLIDAMRMRVAQGFSTSANKTGAWASGSAEQGAADLNTPTKSPVRSVEFRALFQVAQPTFLYDPQMIPRVVCVFSEPATLAPKSI